MQSIRRLDLMREAISMQSEAKVGGASSHAIDSAAGPDEGGNQHAIRGESWRGVIACNRFGGCTFQLQPSPLQQHLANIEVAGGGGEMQRRLSRVRPSMHVNERT